MSATSTLICPELDVPVTAAAAAAAPKLGINQASPEFNIATAAPAIRTVSVDAVDTPSSFTPLWRMNTSFVPDDAPTREVAVLTLIFDSKVPAYAGAATLPLPPSLFPMSDAMLFVFACPSPLTWVNKGVTLTAKSTLLAMVST